MHINGDRANRAARRLAERALEKQTHTIAILSRPEGGFRWGSNSGHWFSPQFDLVSDAIKHAEEVGLKKQDE